MNTRFSLLISLVAPLAVGFVSCARETVDVEVTETVVEAPRASVRIGLEVLASTKFAALRGRRDGVITNPTGVDRQLRSLVDLVAEAPDVDLVAIYGPEHGARGAAQAGEKVGDAKDPKTGVPVFSLYGKTRRPTPEMLRGVEVLLFDIQDIGVRSYTYLSTLIEVLEAAAEQKVEVWVLDRPVPIGADVFAGPVLEVGRESFVGAHTIPLRHGLTAGEFARLVTSERKIAVELRVVAMENYRRSDTFESTSRIWVAPSPNIPDRETALVYAGTVLVEGVATLSEGRGTTRPFRLVGAPWLDSEKVAAMLMSEKLPGVLFRSALFRPTMSKHEGNSCRAVEIHVTNRKAYRPILTALALLEKIRSLHPKELEFRETFFDKLAGTSDLREALERGVPFREIAASWRPELEAYRARRRAVLLYD